MARVLIVEDDEVIGQAMAAHLALTGFEPLLVAKGELGLARLRYERPDVCVLDLMLPERDGWSVIETARAEGIGTPIVVVSARGTEHDRVHALEIGADDYLVKPFSMKELVARRAGDRAGAGRARARQRGANEHARHLGGQLALAAPPRPADEAPRGAAASGDRGGRPRPYFLTGSNL